MIEGPWVLEIEKGHWSGLEVRGEEDPLRLNLISEDTILNASWLQHAFFHHQYYYTPRLPTTATTSWTMPDVCFRSRRQGCVHHRRPSFTDRNNTKITHSFPTHARQRCGAETLEPVIAHGETVEKRAHPHPHPFILLQGFSQIAVDAQDVRGVSPQYSCRGSVRQRSAMRRSSCTGANAWSL